MEEATREGLYWEQFDEAERELLRRAGFDPAEAGAFGAVDGELALLRVLTLRLMKGGRRGEEARLAEAVARLVERVGRVLRARHAMHGNEADDDRLEKLWSRVLEEQRQKARRAARP